MTADMRAMLDELMGRDRNLSLVEKEKQMEHWSDPGVCKYHLVKFCPHDLFTNTRADLGPCKFATHDVKIRETYRTSQRWKTMGYENNFLRFLEGIVDDMERKIRKQHERLEHDERYMKAEQEKADEERNSRLEALNKDIDDMLEKMAEAGSVGNVDEAQEMMKQVENMRQEREAIKTAKVEEPGRKVFLVKQNVPFVNEMKHMEVCSICGAFLVVNDTQTRVDAHLSGKQHVGYALIRDAIKELREDRDKETKENEEKRIAEREKDTKENKVVEDGAKAAKQNDRDGEGSRDTERNRGRDSSRDGSKASGRASIERERSRRDAERFQKLMKYGESRGSGRSSYDRRDRDRRRSRDRRSRSRESRRSRERRDRRDRSRDRSRRSSKEEAQGENTNADADKAAAGEANASVVNQEGDVVPIVTGDGEEKSTEDVVQAGQLDSRNAPSRRSSSRDRGDRSTSRERSSGKYRSRDRSRDRSRRDRSRDRKRRSRSRERRRSRSFERKRSRN